MEENKPFYNCDDDKGVGVLFNGTCGFDRGMSVFSDGKSFPCLKICALKNKQNPGELEKFNNRVLDGVHIDLTFASKESLNIVIGALELMRPMFNEKEK